MKKTPIVRKPESISTRIKIYRALQEAVQARDLEPLTKTSNQKLADRIALLHSIRQELKEDLRYMLSESVIFTVGPNHEHRGRIKLANAIIEVL